MSSVENNSVVPASSEAAMAELNTSADSQRTFEIPSLHPTRPCDVCKNFEPGHIAQTITFSFERLTKSVAAACPSCSLVYQVIMNLKHTKRLQCSPWRWLKYHEDYVYRDRAIIYYDARDCIPTRGNKITLLQSKRGSLSILLEHRSKPHPWLVHVFAEPGEFDLFYSSS